jgi:hypothetical protein
MERSPLVWVRPFSRVSKGSQGNLSSATNLLFAAPNDNALSSAVIKALKRTMAAEHSREMGARIFAGEKRAAELLGFKQGGKPGYGLRRLMISAADTALLTTFRNAMKSRKAIDSPTSTIRVMPLVVCFLCGLTRGMLAYSRKPAQDEWSARSAATRPLSSSAMGSAFCGCDGNHILV